MSERILGLDLDTLRQRRSAKWVHYPADVLPAWVAEMDVLLAEPVQQALEQMLRLGDTGYPRPGIYVEAFRGFAGRHWGWEVDPGACRLAPDVMSGILGLILQLTDQGDTVVINDPVYPPFSEFPAFAGRAVAHAELGPDGRLDEAALATAFASARAGGRRAVFLLSNPHNPTGVAHTREELSMLAAVARAHGVSVISDEIHAPLVFAPATFVPYLECTSDPGAYAVHSAAKAFSLAGLKAGLVVGSPGGEGPLDALTRGPGASLAGVIAQAAAWREGDDWLARVVGELEENAHLVVDLLAQRIPQIRTRVPEATYLMWLDCRELGLGDDPMAHFLEHGRVALSSGLPFGPGGIGHARLNFAASPALLDDVVARMASALR